MDDFTSDDLRNMYLALRSRDIAHGTQAKLLKAMPRNYRKCVDPRWTLVPGTKKWLFDGVPEEDLLPEGNL